mmetsp:Transcript_118340/g.346675  ORF Transcript_118340/g.346675 Transcript_118340/m.346675 type:complete len:131 (-) Transcript_118340:132-524(-)
MAASLLTGQPEDTFFTVNVNLGNGIEEEVMVHPQIGPLIKENDGTYRWGKHTYNHSSFKKWQECSATEKEVKLWQVAKKNHVLKGFAKKALVEEPTREPTALPQDEGGVAKPGANQTYRPGDHWISRPKT